jgi:hypothetical protein
MPTSTLEISGWVSYRIYYDWYANYAALPEIEMSLASQSGNTIRTWNTDDSGSYDQTFSDLANGIYIINMISKNTAARVCDFSSPDPFTLAEEVIVVDGNTVTYWSPVIEDSTLDDACQILVNILKSKSWAQEHFSCTLNFVNAVHPVPGYIPLSGYCFRLFLWHNGPTVPGTDAIYIKKGVSDGYDNDIWGPWGKPVTSHEWAHAFMCKTFDDKIPVGWGPDTSHYKWKVTNPGFAFGEGFAEFMGPAVWLDEYGSGSGDGTGMGKRDTSHIN